MMSVWYWWVRRYDRWIARFRTPHPPEVDDQLDELDRRFWSAR